MKNIFETSLSDISSPTDLKFLSLDITETFDVLSNHNAADVLKWMINTLHEEALLI